MSFAPMQKSGHGRSQRHRRLREGGAVRELQPRRARTRHARLHRQPQSDGVGGKARRNPPAADDTQAQPDGAGPRLLRSVQRAAEPPLRRGARAHPDPEEAGGSSADLRAGHPRPGDVLCVPVLISEDLSAYPGRPVHHHPVPGSDSRKYRRRYPLWRTAGFEPDRPAHRKERALCRRYAGIPPRSASPVAAGRPTPTSMRPSARPEQRGGMASGQRQEIDQAPRLGAGGRERFRRGERLYLSGPRRRPAAIDLLRRSDREGRTHPASSWLVVARNLRARRLSDTPISASEAAGIPRAPEGLEEPLMDSAAVGRRLKEKAAGGPRLRLSDRRAIRPA